MAAVLRLRRGRFGAGTFFVCGTEVVGSDVSGAGSSVTGVSAFLVVFRGLRAGLAVDESSAVEADAAEEVLSDGAFFSDSAEVLTVSVDGDCSGAGAFFVVVLRGRRDGFLAGEVATASGLVFSAVSVGCCSAMLLVSASVDGEGSAADGGVSVSTGAGLVLRVRRERRFGLTGVSVVLACCSLEEGSAGCGVLVSVWDCCSVGSTAASCWSCWDVD